MIRYDLTVPFVLLALTLTEVLSATLTSFKSPIPSINCGACFILAIEIETRKTHYVLAVAKHSTDGLELGSEGIIIIIL